MYPTLGQLGMVNDLRPPQNKPGRLLPKGLRRPLRIKYVDSMASPAQGFALLPPTLVELVDTDDVPVTAKTWNPGQIRCISLEFVSEMANLQDLLFTLA